jgi:hypothetical protein
VIPTYKRRIGRILPLLAVLLLTVGVASALAAAVSGDGTLVGSTGNDAIAAGNSSDTIWGLGGNDTISAGNGDDTIYAGGTCPPGLKAGDYPNGLPSADYCQNNNDQGNDTISVGNGNDTIYGDLGTNTISVGAGTDTIHAGSGLETISVAAGGSGTIFAQNDAQPGQADHITCPKNNGYTVYADKSDVVKGCQTVKLTPPPAQDRLSSAHHKRTHQRQRRRHARHR